MLSYLLREVAMRELILSFIFSFFVLVLTALLLQNFQIESLVQLSVGVIILGLINFIIAPMLLMLKVRPGIFTLGFVTFLMNFLVLNVTTGLIDSFGIDSWVAALFGAVLMSFFQIYLDQKDPMRRKLIG
jgi:putative membrane protein